MTAKIETYPTYQQRCPHCDGVLAPEQIHSTPWRRGRNAAGPTLTKRWVAECPFCDRRSEVTVVQAA